jgi:hypothetical protein
MIYEFRLYGAIILRKHYASVRLWGGIGNQLFIYAFAKWLSRNDSVNVSLETRSGFRKDAYKRKYRLNSFNISLRKTSLYLSLFFLIQKKGVFVKKLLFSNVLLVEDNNSVDEIILPNAKHPIIFYQGYWQHIDFNCIRDVLLKDLVFKLPKNKDFDILADNINKTNSVAVHIRRIQYEPVLPLTYYIDGMEYMKENLISPVFFIFSDDIGFCEKKVNGGGIFINNFKNELFEMKLMSLCKHFIIANSTFSWWGAWLSENKDKKVIIPKGYINTNINGEQIFI